MWAFGIIGIYLLVLLIIAVCIHFYLKKQKEHKLREKEINKKLNSPKSKRKPRKSKNNE